MTWIKQVNNTIHFFFHLTIDIEKSRLKIWKKKKKYNTCITKLICYLYRVHLTAEHIYLKQKKKSKFTRLLHKNCSGTPRLRKRKTVPNKIIHSSPAYINVITSSYHTRLQQRWDDQNTMPFITSSQSKIGEITLNNYIKTRAPRTEWICIEL